MALAESEIDREALGFKPMRFEHTFTSDKGEEFTNVNNGRPHRAEKPTKYGDEIGRGRTGLVITDEDAADWRSRMPERIEGMVSYCIRLVAVWGVRLFIKMDPPHGKLALSTFRWTRASALIAAVALIPALFSWSNPPQEATSSAAGKGNSAKAEEHTAPPVSVKVLGAVPSTIQPGERKTVYDFAGTPPPAQPFVLDRSALGGRDELGPSAPKPPPSSSGGLLTLGVGG
jgi:hypothetical protein